MLTQTHKPTIPVIVAPMFLISGPAMVISSCIAGAIGSFPCTNARTLETLDDWMHQIKSQLQLQNCTTPWAANIITNSTYDRFDAELELIAKHQPPIVITALGSPNRVLATVKAYGGKVYADVNSISYAKKCVEANVDGLILVCTGAGGHTGNLSPFTFVRAVQSFWQGEIVLAGGIANGKAVKSALAMGANYAYMGTRFLAANESLADEKYKQMVIDSTVDDIIMTKAVTGVNANFLIPSLHQAGFDLTNLKDAKIDFNEKKGEKKAWRDVWSAGQGVGSITKRESVAAIIEKLCKEYNNTKT